MTITPQSTPANVQERLRQLIKERGSVGWEEAWKENVTPWDAGRVQPPLKELLESRRLDLPKYGRALVPGCGKGYDALFIASSLGYNTLALDISETAVNAAKELQESLASNSSAKISYELQDFFDLRTPPEENAFDLVYDYTFFVAIPPSRRSEWGHQMSALVKPGGFLIALVFPLDPPQDYGPPFFVRPDDYVKVLGQGWENVIDEIPRVSSETHIGRERLIVWKKL